MAKPAKPPKQPLEAKIAALEADLVLLRESVAALQHQFARTLPRATRRKPSLRSMTDAELSAHRAVLAKKAREHRWPKRTEPAPKKRKAPKR